MWRKIHSNRDPRDTLYSELRNEFGTYFTVAGNACKHVAGIYPKFIFGSMVFLISLSVVLSFTIFNRQEKVSVTTDKKVNPVQDGFDQILQATGNIRETLYLKKIVDSLSAKQYLTAADSALLDSALDRLPLIHQKLK